MDWKHIDENLLMEADGLIGEAIGEVRESRKYGTFVYPSDSTNEAISHEIRSLKGTIDRFEEVFEKAKKQKLKEVT